MHVTVQDGKGNYITGLKREAFSILEDKTPQEISLFSNKDEPLSVAVLFDISGSMFPPKRISNVKKAFARFVRTSHAANEYSLIEFNLQPKLIVDTTRDHNAIVTALENNVHVKEAGQTALYDSCQLGIEKLINGKHKKRVIILFSDGQDNHSRNSFAQLRRSLVNSGILFYAIGFDSPNTVR